MTNEIAQLGFEIDTAALMGAQRAADATAKSLDQMGVAAERAGQKTKRAAEDVKGVAQGAAQATPNVRQLQEMLRQVQGQAANSGQAIEMLSQRVGAMAQGLGAGGAGGLTGALSSSAGMLGRLGSVLGPVGGLLAGVAGGVAAAGGAFVALNATLAQVVDRYALLEGRLKNVYGSASAARDVFASLTDLANKNALSVEQTAESYLRLARNNDAIGLTRQEMLKLTDAVQMLGRVSGASNGELAGAMMQFSQALAAGRLNGDELRSIMENMPALVKAIADGLGVSVGQVRAMGAAGELTGDKITKAILDQVPKIQKEFEGLPQTTEQAFTRVENAWAGLLVNMGKRLDSSGFMQSLYNATAGLIGLMEEAARPETLSEERARLVKQIASPGAAYMGMAGVQNTDPMRERVREIDRQLQVQLYEDMQTIAEERMQNIMAPAKRADGIIKELDKVGTKTKELETQRKTLEETLKLYEKMPFQAIGKESMVAKLPGLISEINRQLRETLPEIDKFNRAVNNRQSDMAAFGSVAFGADVRKLTDTMAASGAPVSQGSAVAAVTAERTQGLREQTAALERQIEVERLRTSALGQGRAAEREAEASAKALQYQLDTFGTVTTPEVTAAINAYRDALLGLSVAQDTAAARSAMMSAQIEMSAQRAAAAVLAAGGGPGAVAEAERNARRAAELGTASPEMAGALGTRFAAEDLQRRNGEAAQLQRLNADLAMQRRLAGGMSPAAARQAQQEQEARQYAEGFSSAAQREIAYQTKLSELRARDAAQERQRLDQRQRSVTMTEMEAELAKLGGIEAQIAIARARELNAIREQGLTLTQEEIDARLKLAEQEVMAQDKLDKAQEAANRYKQMWENVGQSVASSIDGMFKKLLDGEKVKFKDFFEEVMKDIAMILIRAQITQPLANMIGGAGGSFNIGSILGGGGIYGAGGVIAGGHAVTMFGTGGLVSKPTLFPMARGAGLMGEAGAEAILPLKRGPDGRLGVGGAPSNDNGVSVVINDMRSGGEQVQTQEERGADGSRMIRLTIRDEVKTQMKSGTYDAEMNSQYGARRVLARR